MNFDLAQLPTALGASITDQLDSLTRAASQLPPTLVASMTGFVSGLILAMPIGPVNVTLINEGARAGLRRALMIALGAVTMEVIYCTIAFNFGSASFFESRLIKAAMQLTSFVFILYLGMKFINTRAIATENKVERKLEGKFNPHSSFAIGFVRVMCNLGVLLFWIVLATNFMSRDLVRPNWQDKGACISGVALGAGSWFAGLCWAVSRRRKSFSQQTLVRMQHISGFSLLLLAFGHGVHIVWEMAKHRVN